MNQQRKSSDTRPEFSFDQFAGGTGAKVEVISGVPVFTIETDRRAEDVQKIAQRFGENTVFRIINAHFVDEAIKFGTDKANVEEHDFRGVADGAGFDVWGVEEHAKKKGLKKSDVFCGTPYRFFIRGGNELKVKGLVSQMIEPQYSSMMVSNFKKRKVAGERAVCRMATHSKIPKRKRRHCSEL